MSHFMDDKQNMADINIIKIKKIYKWIDNPTLCTV